MAAHQFTQRRRSTQRMLVRHPELCRRVVSDLKDGRTPGQIGNRMIDDGVEQRVRQEKIYHEIYSKEGMARELWRYLPLHRKNRTPCRACRRRKSDFDREVSIHFRQKAATSASEIYASSLIRPSVIA